jgi:membrane associated rhomboid family serine protease
VTQPDLFVVCKNCGSEVSPYVTECPYCGQRVRKRAPKIDRASAAETAARRRRRRLPRVRAEEIEGIAPETRPYATLALIVASLAVSVAFAVDQNLNGDIGMLLGANDDEVWRYFTAPFLHTNLGYQFVTLVATGVFGSMLERRFGPLPVLAIFVAAGAAGCALAGAVDIQPPFGGLAVVTGANGAALGLLVAWLVDDRLAARRGMDRESDLLGVWVFAAVLALLSLAVEEANIAAAVGGAAAGALLASALPLFTRRGAV